MKVTELNNFFGKFPFNTIWTRSKIDEKKRSFNSYNLILTFTYLYEHMMLEIMICSGKSFFSSVTPWSENKKHKKLKMIIDITGRHCIILRCEEKRVSTFYSWLGINKIDNIVKKILSQLSCWILRRISKVFYWIFYLKKFQAWEKV